MVRYLMALVLVFCMSTLAQAVLVEDITLKFTTPTSTTNTLTTTLNTTFGADEQTATIYAPASGGSTVLLDLDCTFDSSTRALTSVNFLEFVGGSMRINDTTYTRYSYSWDTDLVRGPFDTIPAHGTATSGTPGSAEPYTLQTTFPTSQHNIKLNNGKFTMNPPVGDPVEYDLSSNYLSCITASENATLTTELDRIESGNAYYNVSMEFPVNFTATFATNDAYLDTFACEGTLVAEGSFMIEEQNVAPVAEDDFYQVDKNAYYVTFQASEGLLANDWDPNAGDTELLTAPIEYWSAPSHGLIQNNHATGAFQYRPYPNYTGEDTFTYRVYDPAGLYDEGTVTIQVGSPVSIPGDTNGDNFVNEADASILSDHWMEYHTGPENGDFNGDGFVDATDASIMAANWGNHNEGEGNAVPEPSTIILLLTGLAAVGLSRRR